jgi:hypothetical protein
MGFNCDVNVLCAALHCIALHYITMYCTALDMMLWEGLNRPTAALLAELDSAHN